MKNYHVVSTNFHDKGLISSHNTQELAESAAHNWMISDCSCGCCRVVPTEDLLTLPCDAENLTYREVAIFSSDLRKIFKKDIQNLVRNIKETKLSDGQLQLELLFKANGRYSGHPWAFNCAYSTEDLEKNGDYKLNKLPTNAKQVAYFIIEEAIAKANELQQPFGRGNLFHHQLKLSDIDEN